MESGNFKMKLGVAAVLKWRKMSRQTATLRSLEAKFSQASQNSSSSVRTKGSIKSPVLSIGFLGAEVPISEEYIYNVRLFFWVLVFYFSPKFFWSHLAVLTGLAQSKYSVGLKGEGIIWGREGSPRPAKQERGKNSHRVETSSLSWTLFPHSP